MNLIAFSLRGKGPRNFLRRIFSIGSRFGFTSVRMERSLLIYIEALKKYGVAPTFPITAAVLQRHHTAISSFLSDGVEFAIHGFTHGDYSQMSAAKQKKELEKAVATFRSCRIPFSGFRPPYLRMNRDTEKVLPRFSFNYVSSATLVWEVFPKHDLHPKMRAAYDRALRLYKAKSASYHSSLPRIRGPLVQIPVSLPDDEMLVDRVGIPEEEIAAIWKSILDRTYERGELFTLQLHPERVQVCRGPLESVLERAREKDPPVWVATLEEIAQWWQERSGFRLEIEDVGQQSYKVTAFCSPRATLLARGEILNYPHSPWYGAWSEVKGRSFILRSSCRPVIGVSPSYPLSLTRRLKDAGYPVEVTAGGAGYQIYLSSKKGTLSDEVEILKAVEARTSPLIRFGAWPNGCRSALAITGDIDAITIWDFLCRLWEVR